MLELKVDSNDLPVKLTIKGQPFIVRDVGNQVNISPDGVVKDSKTNHLLVTEFGEDFCNVLCDKKPLTSISLKLEY